MQRILIVDDDRLVADTIGLIFQKHGFDVRTVYSAHEALSSAREFSPNLMLCDIDMPGRDGLELMGDMADQQPDCQVLVLTGFYSALAKVRAMPRRVGVLTKPCPPVDLLREAGEMLRSA
jgi:DNA-binding response OmpR family regulator